MPLPFKIIGHLTAEGMQQYRRFALKRMAARLQSLTHGSARQLGMVVLLAEMAEPHAAQIIGAILAQSLARGTVAQVAVLAKNAMLEVPRVRAVLQHLGVVVGLNDNILGLREVVAHFLCHLARIGNQAQGMVAKTDEVAIVVGTVMRNSKGGDTKGANLLRLTLLKHTLLLGLHLLGDEAIARDALVHTLGGIDRQVQLRTQCADSLDVVGMVVRDKDAKHLSERKSVRAEMLLERAKRQSQINDEPLPLVPKIVTIATTTTAETIEFYIRLIHG